MILVCEITKMFALLVTVPALRGKDYGKSKMSYPDYTETESGLQYKVILWKIIDLFWFKILCYFVCDTNAGLASWKWPQAEGWGYSGGKPHIARVACLY